MTNAREVVRQRIGRLGERLIGKVADADAQVEKELMKEMEIAFQEFGIEARILSVSGVKTDEMNCWKFHLKLDQKKMFFLKTNKLLL